MPLANENQYLIYYDYLIFIAAKLNADTFREEFNGRDWVKKIPFHKNRERLCDSNNLRNNKPTYYSWLQVEIILHLNVNNKLTTNTFNEHLMAHNELNNLNKNRMIWQLREWTTNMYKIQQEYCIICCVWYIIV